MAGGAWGALLAPDHPTVPELRCRPPSEKGEGSRAKEKDSDK